MSQQTSYGLLAKAGRFSSYLMLTTVKWVSAVFYRFEENWLNVEKKQVDWDDIRLIVFLNHTSLFEPIFIKLAPNRFIWRISQNLLVPGADVTLQRPILGRFYRFLLPGAVPITRKKDKSWQDFMSRISNRSIIAILPEGRMKRLDGNDKFGKPMSARGGIADILSQIDYGNLLFVYSGGLHHVQAPGEKLPRIFKKVKANLELVSINSYKARLMAMAGNNFKSNLVSDLNQRLKSRVPG